MTQPIRLREMLLIAKGEVNSLADLIALHRKKNTRPQSWLDQHERILQHRRQVVSLVQAQVERRAEEMDKEKAA